MLQQPGSKARGSAASQDARRQQHQQQPFLLPLTLRFPDCEHARPVPLPAPRSTRHMQSSSTARGAAHASALRSRGPPHASPQPHQQVVLRHVQRGVRKRLVSHPEQRWVVGDRAKRMVRARQHVAPVAERRNAAADITQVAASMRVWRQQGQQQLACRRRGMRGGWQRGSSGELLSSCGSACWFRRRCTCL